MRAENLADLPGAGRGLWRAIAVPRIVSEDVSPPLGVHPNL